MKILDTILKNRRPLIMIFAMFCGVLFHEPISVVDSAARYQISPMLIFGMLFVTFCRVRISDMRVSKMHFILLFFQIAMAIVAYYLLLPLLGSVVAQGAMICFLAPVAMGAVVIGGILGANVSSIATYSLLCNFVIAIIAPYMLSEFGNGECTFVEIMQRVAPLLILPFIMAQIFRRMWRRGSAWIAEHGGVSFYFWLFAMAITLSRTTTFILEYNEYNVDSSLSEQVILASMALLSCIMQFVFGRIIGHRYGDSIAAGQSLGQKNTVLAVWLSHSFLDPISSIAPTSYIIWQNLINSLQIYLHDNSKSRQE